MSFFYLRSRAAVAESDSGCTTPGTVRLTASPDIAPAMVEAAEKFGMVDCAEVAVTALAADQVVAALVAGSDQAPDLWVPDSAGWVQQLASQGVPSTELSKAVASSPVTLVGGPAADVPSSWFEALSSGRVSMRDPLSTGTGALALAGLRAEQSASGVSDDQIRQMMVPLAQGFSGARAKNGAVDPVAKITASDVRLVPTSEQAYLTARRSNNVITAVTPRTGSLLQTYPLVAGENASPQAVEIGREFAAFLTGAEGRALLAERGFRNAAGAPLPGGAGIGTVGFLALPDQAALQGDRQQWLVLTVPSSLLAVVDVSGSMDFRTPAGSRIELATKAAQAALAAYPNNTRIGLWAFSVDQGGKGVDYRKLVKLRRLDTRVGDKTQRELLHGQALRMKKLTNGGTGLYDTAIAAYREAVASYDPSYFNSVVLMTDGANDDPGSLRLRDLLKALRSASDPQRPVRIIAIGISKDADMKALTEIAKATNGAAYGVDDPRDILAVLAQALLGR